MPKLRVDLLLQRRGLAESREQAQRLISAGRVRSGTLVLVKASQTLDVDAELVVSEPERYVSRGGHKLEAALQEFGVDPSGRVCLDLGASTGGFTDCLLQHGAAGVIAVDVGRAQLHAKLRNDPRVVLLEQTNARELPEMGPFTIHDSRFTIDGEAEATANDELRTTNGDADGGPARRESKIKDRQSEPDIERGQERSSFEVRRSSISLFVADLSFISLRKVLPSVAGRLAPGTEGVVLLKPQFEAGRKDVPRGGVIKDESVVERVRAEFVSWCEGEGWAVYGMIRSPIRGGDGNVEMLVHLATPNDELRTTNVEDLGAEA